MTERHESRGVVIVAGGKFQTPKCVFEKHRLSKTSLTIDAPNIVQQLFGRPGFLVETLALQPNFPNLDLAQQHRRSGRKLEMTAQEGVVIQQFINHRNVARSAPQKQAQALASWNSCALYLMYFEVLGLQRCLSFSTQRKVISAQRDDPIRDTLVQSGCRNSVTRLLEAQFQVLVADHRFCVLSASGAFQKCEHEE